MSAAPALEVSVYGVPQPAGAKAGPAIRHVMAGRFVTLCGVRFDPARPVARGRTPDGKRGVDCVVCSDLYRAAL